ncbi:MAG: HAD family phosphatase [Bifidobacteriaceae bacterium]|jgi:HAD superfamily hydrolase (TIGR01509 family)|nr:HAD family phosphatase [Bifidobacteriaceae bacterium]
MTAAVADGSATVRAAAVPGAVFDMDGTLLDSMGVWTQVDIDFFARRSIPMPADYSSTVIAMPFEQIARYTIDRFHLPDTPAALMNEWNEMVYYSYTHTVQAKPHAVEYLNALHEHGVPLAVATSLPPQLRDAALSHVGIHGVFDALCSTDDVERGKDHADIYLFAAGRLNVAPRDCYVFEDILTGIRSSSDAGMHAWGVLDESSEQDWQDIARVAEGAITDFSQAPELWKQ